MRIFIQIEMEKYIFDSRQNHQGSPKFLKRNYPVDLHPTPPPENTHTYLQNKIFDTFDYSYYHDIPLKHSSLHSSIRIHNLQSLMTLPLEDYKISDYPKKASKWKQQKMKSHHECVKSSQEKKKKNRILMPKTSYPSIGHYNLNCPNIHKKIVYDVKLRGKPKQISCQDQKQNSVNNKTSYLAEKFQCREVIRPTSYHNERRQSSSIKTPEEEDYYKFINSIEIGVVWKKLMHKHSLKGSKFDFHIPQ